MSEITLYGTVGESFWGEEHFTPSTVRAQLAEVPGDVTVRINSGGGIATDGQAIYNLLKDHPGAVHVVVDGIAASAASLIAMAGDTITMKDGAMIMIHDPAQPWIDGRGTEADHLRAARSLGIMSSAYARVYAKRSGMTPDEARAVMRDEVYFVGQAAVDAGFATATDEEPARAFAAFDYAAYAHAPQELLDAGAGLARRTSNRRAVAALMAGIAAPKPKGQNMATDHKMEDEDTLVGGEGEDTLAAEGEDTLTGGDDTDPEGGDEDESQARAVAILHLAGLANLDTAAAADLVKSKMTLEQVAAHLTAQKAKGNPMTGKLKPGAPVARILRDERDTRRRGMEGALIAQMSRAREVTGPARDFMDMGIIHMAAASVGHRGAIRRGGQEQRLLEMAFAPNSTSDFPAVFENALNKRLLDAYAASAPTYRDIATRMDFTDFRPHPISGMGAPPTLLPLGEGGEIKAGSSGDKKEVVSLQVAARQFHLTRQMLVNDDLGAIDRMLSQRGLMVAAYEEAYFYAMMLGGANSDGPTLLETTRQVFNATDGTKAGSGAAITVLSLSAGRQAMRGRKGLGKDAADKLDLNIAPSILLVGPAKETEAEQLITTINPNQAASVNPFSGRLRIVVTNKIPDNAWYLFAEPAMAPVFMYGHLSGEAGPRMRMDEPFGVEGVSYSVALDFGAGAIDFRGAYKNPGA